MKTIKYLLWMIILVVLGIFVYQNLDYFMTTTILKIDLKINDWNWTIPELQNLAYFGICFFLGFFIAAIRGFIIKLGLKKEIKTKNATIDSLNAKLNDLKSELDVFQHDPYIKKELDNETFAPAIEHGQVEPEKVKSDLTEPESIEPEQDEPGIVEPEQPIPEPFEAEKLESENHEPEQIEPEQIEPEQFKPEQPESDQPLPEPVETGNKEGEKSNTAD